MNDAQLFRWLEQNPGRVSYSQGYLGAKHRWFFTARGVCRQGRNLRDAIARAITADERFEARMKRLGFRDPVRRRKLANS